MFIVNGIKATLRAYNRTQNNAVYDDEDFTESTIKICPYNVAQSIQYGTYTHPEATGYYIIKRTDDVREGDALIFRGKTHVVLKVQDNWIFNRAENKVVAVK